MPRLARIVIPGVPHHIVQRGNNRQDVFFVDDDYRVYLEFLKEHADRYGLQLWGYCLMTNHIHLIATPSADDSLAMAIGRTHFRYSQYINRFHGRSGHLWEGRFHSCALDEPHFWVAVRYVEQNPVRAKMTATAWEYEWSSAEAHVALDPEDPLLDLSAWGDLKMPSSEWRKMLRRGVKKDESGVLRKSTHRGWPMANDRTIAKFEKLLGKRVRPLPTGRPVGAKDKKKRKRRRSAKAPEK